MPANLGQEQFPFLKRLSQAARAEVTRLAAAQAQPGAQLVRRGDAADGAFLVVAGQLRVYYVTAEGREATLYHVEPGGTCVLSLTSTIEGSPYPAWVNAGAAGGKYVRVPSEMLLRLMDAESAFRQFVMGVLSGRIFELMCALEEIGSAQIEQRVARYLLRRSEADGCVRVTQVGIASDLGTAREVVFRALRSLAQRKLVHTERKCIRVLDRDGLTRAAGTA